MAEMFLSKLGFRICSRNLPSKELYDKWDKHLESIVGTHNACKLTVTDYKNDDKFLKLCSTALDYIKNYDKSTSRKQLSCNDCKLFNYWLLNKIKEEFKGKYQEVFNVLVVLWKGNNILNHHSRGNKCELDFNIASDDKSDVKKQFYEYLEDYQEVHVRAKMKDNECKKYKNYYDNNSLLGGYIKEILPDVEKNGPSSIYGENNNCNSIKVLPRLLNNTFNLSGGYAINHIHEEGLVEAIKDLQKEIPKLEEEETEASSEGAKGGFDLSNLFSWRGSSPKVGSSALSVAGVSTVSLFLYKLTPLGPMLRKRFWSSRPIINSSDQGQAQPFPDFYEEYANVNPDFDRINIAYSPSLE
ncbi:PIR protein [Plasmodium vivax]|nr:PIR protein [Plasmodium vivax]